MIAWILHHLLEIGPVLAWGIPPATRRRGHFPKPPPPHFIPHSAGPGPGPQLPSSSGRTRTPIVIAPQGVSGIKPSVASRLTGLSPRSPLPAQTPRVSVLERILHGVEPAQRPFVPLAVKYGAEYGVPPSVLMGLIGVESGFDKANYRAGTSSAGAGGSTQFMPGTAADYGVKFGSGPSALKSQVRGAAKYLKDLGFHQNPISALAQYNGGSAPPASSFQYAKDVLSGAETFSHLNKVAPHTGMGHVPQQTVSRFQAVKQAATALNKLKLPYSLGAGHVAGNVPNPRKLGALDCSSTVSWVLQKAGYKFPTAVSGDMMKWGKPGPGAVTIFANPEHVFLRIGNRYFGTSHANPGGGPGFIPTSYEEGEARSGRYTVRHLPGLGKDVAAKLGFTGGATGGFGGGGGIALSSNGTQATVTSGEFRSAPGFSRKPILSDVAPLRSALAARAPLPEAFRGGTQAESDQQATDQQAPESDLMSALQGGAFRPRRRLRTR